MVQVLRLVDSVRKGLFVVGTALLVFVAARNTITWHLQRFWGASGDFWQQQWENIYKLSNRDSFYLMLFGTNIFTFLVFWVSNIFLIVLDLTGKPAALLRYKVQPDKNIPLPAGKLWHAAQLVLFNQIVIGIPFSIVMSKIMEWRGCSVSPDELPTFQWVVLELIICVLVEELGFYYSHRLLHRPSLYKYIHKQHHEWTAPIGIISIYAHPIEHILSNLLPPALGPLLLGSHLATSWMWFSLALWSTTIAHSGYHFPFLPSPEAHDYHHLKARTAQELWDWSGNFCHQQWSRIYDLSGRDPFYFSVAGTNVLSFLVFWLPNIFLIYLDLTGRPAFLLRYKIQPGKNVPVSRRELWRAVKLVLINQILVSVPFSILVAWVMARRGNSVLPEDLPTLHWLAVEVAVCILMEEIAFYYSHRLLHHPSLYKHIHKRHHEWTAPIGIIALYAHPIEHIFSNLLPPALGPLLLGSHVASSWVWFSLALLSTTVSHSGYHFPFLPSPEAHDYHHLKFNQNYGVLGLLDRLHGTDDQFRASQEYRRHCLTLSLTPVSQQFPDSPVKNKSK